MKTLLTVSDMRSESRAWKSRGLKIGFVPTMGFLHEGHLSLVRESKRRADVTVVSVFVNPAQFGPNEDLAAYPRDLASDSAVLEKEGVDCLFHPAAGEMYAAGHRTFVEVLDLQDRLCGRTRPGHFRGVCTVVLKLFEIVGPDMAFFGWKDAQQVVILKKMVEDLNLPVEIIPLPLVRDADGLALSSRNSYLSAEERRAARILGISLKEAADRVSGGEVDSSALIRGIRRRIEGEPLARIDYVEIVDPADLSPVSRIDGEALMAVAVSIGKTRLIDNMKVGVKR